jgi:hypothetical protein
MDEPDFVTVKLECKIITQIEVPQADTWQFAKPLIMIADDAIYHCA